MPEPVRVFVSHSHIDNDFGVRMVKDLRQALGSDDAVWYDAYGGLRGGDDWWDKIVEELTARPVFIVILSPAAMAAKYVQTEFKLAFQQSHSPAGKRIIPVLYQPCEPRADMNLFQRVNFADKTYRQAFDDLLTALEERASTPATKTQAAATLEQVAPIPVPQGNLIGSIELPPDQFPESLRKLGFMPRMRGDIPFIYPPWQPVPAGDFLMGSDPSRDKDTLPDETPQHTVTLPAFQIARFPVTVAEYRCAVQDGKREPKNWGAQVAHLDHPVTGISWRDAVAYAHWLRLMAHESWRVPTEAQWEKAARGTDGRIYPWGDEFDAARCNSSENGPHTTTPVGAYPSGASPYGAQDMAGNVEEWTPSFAWPYPYSEVEGRGLGHEVLRGGSWSNTASTVRAAYRGFRPPGGANDIVGFRLAREAPST